jgi:hypothetical protein
VSSGPNKFKIAGLLCKIAISTLSAALIGYKVI